MMTALPVGKLDPEILGNLLSRYTRVDTQVIIGAGIGEDAAVIDTGPVLLVAKTDPITHVTSEIGRYAVHINANDIAAMGGTPRWFLATILMPKGSRVEDITRIFAQLSESCNEIGVIYCGGHTEVTTGVNNPVVVGHMLGEASRATLKPSSGAGLGDTLLMTKAAALEASAIIAFEKEEELRTRFPEDVIREAQGYLRNPGLSVLKEAKILSAMQGVHALHDPTEGGIATGVFEIAEASGLGALVYADEIPVTETTKILCAHFGIDPLGAFASGALLAAVSPQHAERAIKALAAAEIPAACIGRTVERSQGLRVIRGKETLPLPVFHQDELSKLFG